MRPPSNPSEISPDPTFDPSRNISGRKRIRFPDESTTDTPTRKNSSCFSRDGKICDVKTTGRGTGAVPMAAVRQNKVRDIDQQAVTGGSTEGQGEAVSEASEKNRKGKKSSIPRQIDGLRYGNDVEKELMMKICVNNKHLFNGGKFVPDKSRVELHGIITENFLEPVRKSLLKNKSYRARHSRQDIDAKFGSRGVRGFRGWIASQRLQERMRRSRFKGNGMEGNDILSNFENLRSQMFAGIEKVNGDRTVESINLESSTSSLGEVATCRVAGSSSQQQPSHNDHVCQDGNHSDALNGFAEDSIAGNEFDREKTNDPSRSSTTHGETSSAAVDSSLDDGGQARSTLKGGKGKARMSEEADSSAKVPSGGEGDGDDGHGNQVLSNGDLGMAAEDTNHIVDNTIIDNDETAIESITSDNLTPSEEIRKPSQRDSITSAINELRRLRDESRRLHSIRLEQMQIEDRCLDALEKVSNTLSQVATNMSKSNTNKGGEDAVKNFRSLLDLHNDPKFDVVVSGDNFRKALAEANRQQLTREDGQALLSIILEINGNDSIDVKFTAMEVHPAYRASKM